MGDEAKTREQLVSELAGMRRRVVQLEALEIEHQRAEKAVLQSEERLRIAGDGTVLYANEAGQPLLGLWECQLGQCVSVDWQRLVSDVVRSGFRKESEVQCDERTLLLTFAPTAGTEYVNVYGLDITERKRAEEALRRRNQGLALLNQAGRELTATLDLQQVVERALQAVTETIGAEDASVWLWDEEQEGWLVCQTAYHRGQNIALVNLRVRAGQGVVGWVAQTGESVIIADKRCSFLNVTVIIS